MGKNLFITACIIATSIGISFSILASQSNNDEIAGEIGPSTLPNDLNHATPQSTERKQDIDKYCITCHEQGGRTPLSENHPAHSGCLYCHKP